MLMASSGLAALHCSTVTTISAVLSCTMLAMCVPLAIIIPMVNPEARPSL